MNSSALWVVVGILVIAGLGYWAYTAQAPAPATNVNVETPAATNPGSTDTGVGAGAGVDVGIGDASATVTYSASGFSPQEIAIKRGGTVTWNNSGGGAMWVASAQHPTHTTYSGTTLAAHCDDATDTSFDQCAAASTYSFTFDKVGTWPYHNHSNSSHFGRVIVTE